MIKFENANEASRYYQEVEKFQKVYQVECYLLKMARFCEITSSLDTEDIYNRNKIVEQLISYTLKVENTYPTLYIAITTATEYYENYDCFVDEGPDLRFNDHYKVLTDGIEEPSYPDLIQWYKIYSSNGKCDPVPVLGDIAEGCGVDGADDPDIHDILNLGMVKHWEKLFLETRVPKKEILDNISDIRFIANYGYHDGECALESRLDQIEETVGSLKNKLTGGENNG